MISEAIKDVSQDQIDQALKEARMAFLSYRNFSGKKKGEFLRSIAAEIDALGAELVSTAMKETSLSEERIISERGRTTGHLRMFADLIEEGSWVDVRIDHAVGERVPTPKPDLRKMSVPIGPVVVFGAANFPLAYSTAGGDTASALAAGCPVIVKAHPAHAATSGLVAKAIQKAMISNGMPIGVFQHVHGAGFEVGRALVTHPFTRAVGFTGSLSGGKALFDLANARPEPIPVFAEMSSINPVVLLPESLAKDARVTASKIAVSLTQGVGQFCTNPGLVIAIDGPGLNEFILFLAEEIVKTLPGTMLHQGIADNYARRLQSTLSQKGVKVEAQSASAGNAAQGRSLVASVPAAEFLKNPELAEEVFGPFSLIVRCAGWNEVHSVVQHIRGQLTATLIGGEEELAEHPSLLNAISEKAGRLIINGVPTGVEVGPAMQHGGPFPATTDSRFTSVGTDAIRRFVRPLAFQNFPEQLLPEELKESNPLKIWRLVDGSWTNNDE